ncbi:MAG TPA: tRNA threonylcarbamoyladenosine dehydratase [Coriobacteriia bacterium]|nr:tRNA threonylcarbamoyladenosine dehydratase [Coriobacteriia bacterium]
MTQSWLERTELLLGEEKLDRLNRTHVLVVGLGGVGAYAAEMLARAGIGRLTIADSDTVSPGNINRQLVALHSTVGEPKAEVLAGRLKDINPTLDLTVVDSYIQEDTLEKLLDAAPYDYVVDAIDTLSPKVFFIYEALKRGFSLVSSMGAGGRIDPTKVEIADIGQTHSCPLAKKVRVRLHRRDIHTGFKAVFSPESIQPSAMAACNELNKKTIVGTISYMPAIFGCTCASVVIRDLIGTD